MVKSKEYLVIKGEKLWELIEKKAQEKIGLNWSLKTIDLLDNTTAKVTLRNPYKMLNGHNQEIICCIIYIEE